MKALSSTSWGASSKILRLFYVAYIRSKMEYASVMFMGVVTTLKHKLKVIQNICHILMLGARNTTRIRSMEVEANIAPLDSRQEFLLAKLFCQLCYMPANNETTKLLLIESGSDVAGVQDSFRMRATFAVLNIGMHSWCVDSRIAVSLPPWVDLG